MDGPESQDENVADLEEYLHEMVKKERKQRLRDAGIGNFQCPKCAHKFRDRRDLDRHTNRKNPCLTEHKPEENKPFCKLCNRVFSTKYTLYRHVFVCKMSQNALIEKNKQEEPALNFEDERESADMKMDILSQRLFAIERDLANIKKKREKRVAVSDSSDDD